MKKNNKWEKKKMLEQKMKKNVLENTDKGLMRPCRERERERERESPICWKWERKQRAKGTEKVQIAH